MRRLTGGDERAPWPPAALRSAAVWLATLVALAPADTAAQVRSGSYVGSGAPRSIVGVGFRPDVVIVKGNENTVNRAVVKTATMGALAKGMTSSIAAASGLITTLDADGFSLSGDNQVNQNGIPYRWIAFKMVPGESAVGDYSSTGPSDDRNITGLGFQPAYVIVIPEAGRPVYQRSSSMLGDLSFDFDNSTGDTDRIQALLPDGFQVGGNADVNGGGLFYNWVAWKAVPGRMAVGSYVGDDSDNRSISGLGMRPEYVIVKRDGTVTSNGAVHKPVSTGPANDVSLLFNLSNDQVDAIQALEADGFQVGTQARVNFAGDTFYWMAFADAPALGASEGPGTVTVTAPMSFELRFSTASGGGIDRYFDLADDPARAFDIAGGNVQALFNHAVVSGGIAYESGVNGIGSKLDLLEATSTRVRVRQESFFQSATSTILPRARGQGDYSVYATGRFALGWRRRTTGALSYTSDDIDIAVRSTGSDPFASWTAYGESNGVGFPGPGNDAFLLYVSDTPGVRTDFLAILHRDWSVGNGNFETANRTDTFTYPPDELRKAYWQDTTGGLIPAGFSESWSFLAHFKPTDFINHSTPASTTRRDDYRGPAALAIAIGGPWNDAAEGTATDDFNESEGAYLATFDPVQGLRFDISGSPVTRHTPFFKLRQWRHLGPPKVTLEGAPLFPDADYRADVKPVARAHLAPGLAWHCTLESTAACDPGSLDVGSTGSALGVGAIRAGRYGNAAEFTADAHSATAGSAGSADFSPAAGAVELWYQPYYDHGDGARHLIWYNQSGTAPDFGCLGLEKDATNQLRFVAFVNYSDDSCAVPDGNSAVYIVSVSAAGYAWRALDWVHLKTTWDASAAKKMRLFVDSREVAFSGSYTAPLTHGPTVFGGCQGASCPGGPGNAAGLIDEPHIYTALDTSRNDVERPLAHGGLQSDTSEFLADPGPSRNATLGFAPVDAERRGPYAYFGADSKFRGLNVSLLRPGSGAAAAGLQWEYWNGAQWASVAGLTDTTESFQRNGSVFWGADPVGWKPWSVNGGPDLYFVRLHLAGAPYSTLPIERLVKTDILLLQYQADVTAAGQTFELQAPPQADLAIVKSDASTSAVPGNPITYTIAVTNNGPDTVTSLFVNDLVPPALGGVAFAPSAGAYNPVTGEWTGLSLAATQSVQLLVSGTVDPFARGSLVNSASVSPPAGFGDPVGSNDFASDTDTLAPLVDVSVVKTGAPGTVPLGGLVTYTLTVANAGPSGATNVTVQDPLPADMALDAAAGAITTTHGSCSYNAGSRTVSCALGSLATTPATVTIKVRPQALHDFVNTATTSRTETDSQPSNDSESETTVVSQASEDVLAFTATSRSERVLLEWVNPTDPDYLRTEVLVRADTYPLSPSDPLATSLYDSDDTDLRGSWRIAHDTGAGTNGQTFYYAAFVHRSSAPMTSAGRFVSGRPFDHTGPVKWAFSTGATALTAPTVGGAGVIATSNDHMLYAMERGTDDDGTGVDSGEWPGGFVPVDVGEPVQSRSPVVPVDLGGSNPVIFAGSQDGNVYAIDAVQGGAAPYLWVESLAVAPASLQARVQAAPAGIFSDFGATLDYLFVGTYDSGAPNIFFALDPQTGNELGRYDTGDIGIVSAMAAVEYGPTPPRVYFTSHAGGTANTLWCFDLNLSPPPVWTPRWQRALGHIESSPILRGGRVYVGSPTGGGTVHSIDAMDGANIALDRSYLHGNGQVKGFVFPDRSSNDLYFATDDYVWGLTDTGALTMSVKYGGPIGLPGGARPSAVLFVPGSHYLYVGASDGKLYEIDTAQASPTPKPVTLGDGTAVVGAPSYDHEHGLIHVGTEAGIFYAVQVPLP